MMSLVFLLILFWVFFPSREGNTTMMLNKTSSYWLDQANNHLLSAENDSPVNDKGFTRNTELAKIEALIALTLAQKGM